MNKRLILLSSVPGGGKSELAQWIAGCEPCICSADDYPGYYTTGSYVWSSEVCTQARQYCRSRAQILCKQNRPLVVIDNTNLTVKARKFYIDLAKTYGYELQIISIEPQTDSLQKYAERNKHGVTLDKIKDMFKAYWKDRLITAENALRS